MSFTAKDVAALREQTGAGMMDCKRALQECDGDMEKALLSLREKGLAAAAKKATRIAAEGMVHARVCKCGVSSIVEVNSETDFAAKSDQFIEFVETIAKILTDNRPLDVNALNECAYGDSGLTVAEMTREKVLVIGENINIRRFAGHTDGFNVAYNHMGGRIGVLINLTVSDNLKDNDAVTEMGKNIAMQTAAMRPQWLRPEDVDAAAVETEKGIIMTQMEEEGKPEQTRPKILEGRINKYFSEVCLLKQPYVKENSINVQQYIDQTAKKLGGEITLNSFVRFEKGEGLAKREENFADEVAKMM